MGTVFLIEYQNHHEVLLSLGELFRDLGFRVVVLTNENCRKKLSDLTVKNELTILDFIDFSSIDFYPGKDLCIYITPFKIEGIENLPINAENSYLLIHNLNYWLNPFNNISLLKNPFTVKGLNIFKYWKLNTKWKNDDFLKRFKGLLAPSGLRYDNFIKSKLSGTLDISYCRPEPPNLQDDANVIRIVTPGTVNSDRNYLMVIKLLAQASMKHQQKIEYILLGQNQSMSYDSIKKYINQNFKIQLFESEVSHDRFTTVMKDAHFCIMPLKKEKNYKGINELRGKTSISGGYNDVLRSITPTMIPGFYPIPESISSLFTSYHHQKELELLIDRWISKKTFLKIKEESYNDVKNYMKQVLESQRKKLSHLIDA